MVHPAAASIPGILAGGVFRSRWMPPEIPLRVSALESAGAPSGEPATPTPVHDARSSAGDPSLSVADIRPMIPLGQFRDTFIIAIDDESVAIIDQHVAHERVLFERVMQRLSVGPLESQRLLVPMLVDLQPSALDMLLERTAELARLGFEAERFGDRTLKVTAVPALLDAAAGAQTLRALADDLEGLDSGADLRDALQRIAATTACHAAVKAHFPLTYEKMAHILDELRATAYSTVCPHGRPVMLRLTRREIEKNFERI
jgi:DNA mismatch repair protein MutL